MIDVPYLSYEDVERQAQEFYDTYGKQQIPVCIDRIIEFDLDIEIRPIPGLADRFEGGGYATRDWSCISYDQSQVDIRARFTLAHEVGHFVLHKEIFDALPQADSIEEWAEIYRQIPSRELGWLEAQANKFAACLLIPRSALEAFFFDEVLPTITPLCQTAVQQGIRRSKYIEMAISYAAGLIATRFNVSTEQTAIYRFCDSGLVVEVP